MSKALQPTIYNGKSLENQWKNNFWSSHELICGCNDPLLHIITLFNKEGNAPKPFEELKNIKCLIIGKPTTTEEDGFGPGELEKLFEEDKDGDDTAAVETTTDDTG